MKQSKTTIPKDCTYDPMGCQTKPQLPYGEFFEDCERREAAGDITAYCMACRRWRWQDERCPQFVDAECIPDDPESHQWRRVGESHTPDGRTIYYECVRCGATDSS